MNLLGLYVGEPDAVIRGLELEYTNSGSASKTAFVKTNLSYKDFMNEIHKYMTDRCFENNFGEDFYEEDGMLCYFNGGATGVIYTLKEAKYEENKYIATVQYMQETYTKDLEFEFELTTFEGRTVVDNCIQK